MGFAAILSGNEVAVGDTWQWQGNLLNIQDCGKIVVTCKLDSIVERDGERCALITGSMSNWPGDYRPQVSCELLFSLARAMPVNSKLEFASAARKQVIRTRLVSIEPAESKPDEAKKAGQ